MAAPQPSRSSAVPNVLLGVIVVFSFAFVGAWLVGQLLVKRPDR